MCGRGGAALTGIFDVKMNVDRPPPKVSRSLGADDVRECVVTGPLWGAVCVKIRTHVDFVNDASIY